MGEIKNLIRAEELVVKLNQYFQSEFSVNTIVQMRNKKIIPAVDVRTPGTKLPRWKYNLDDVIQKLKTL